MPKYGANDRYTNKKGMKGADPGWSNTDSANQRWFPEVLFQPQEPGPVNRANCKPVEPTWFYQEQDMPVFRPRGPGDTEDLDCEPGSMQGDIRSKPKNTDRYYHSYDWDGPGSRTAPPRTKGGGRRKY